MASSKSPAFTMLMFVMLLSALFEVVAALPSSSFASSAEKTLMLATTTSVDATGLLNLLADEFKAETGIVLKWTAVGTGAAIKQARGGNAGAALAHPHQPP